MATPTSAQRRIEEKLNIIESSLQAALKATEGINVRDIESTSYANGKSIFNELVSEIIKTQGVYKRIKWFKSN